MQKLNYHLRLRTDQPAKDGRCKVALHLSINGARVRISLPIAIHPDFWDDNKQCARAKGDLLFSKQINTYVLSVRRKVDEIFFDALNNDSILTVDKFDVAFNRKAASGDFLTFMENEIEAARPHHPEGTIKAWVSAYNHLRQCFDKIGYGDIGLDLVKRFDLYLRRKKLEHNYISKVHSFLRKYIILANKKGKKVGNPYADFKLTVRKKEREYLTAAEVVGLRTIYARKELPSHLQKSLRHFLFQIATSLRYSDLVGITTENIVGNSLVFCPIKTQKTGKMVRVVLSEMALAMLADREGLGDNLFDVYKEQNMNRWLKQIADYAGIGKKFTTHMGRHTFGFLFIASGGQIEVLQKIMGHSDLKTTQVYTHINSDQIGAGVRKMDDLLSSISE
jgi:site-specific recombinase XerD